MQLQSHSSYSDVTFQGVQGNYSPWHLNSSPEVMSFLYDISLLDTLSPLYPANPVPRMFDL